MIDETILEKIDAMAGRYMPPQRKLTADDYTLPDDNFEDTEVDQHRNAPVPSEECLYGLIGDIAREASVANKEVNPYASAFAAIVALSAGVGRGCFMSIGDDWHHPRVFGLHVGRSGKGRKGTSTKLVTRIVRNLFDKHLDVAFKIPVSQNSCRISKPRMIRDKATHNETTKLLN